MEAFTALDKLWRNQKVMWVIFVFETMTKWRNVFFGKGDLHFQKRMQRYLVPDITVIVKLTSSREPVRSELFTIYPVKYLPCMHLFAKNTVVKACLWQSKCEIFNVYEITSVQSQFSANLTALFQTFELFATCLMNCQLYLN